MSKFKKIFIILASIICASVLTFIISTNSIKSNVSIAVGKPYSVVVFDHATTGTESKEESKFNEIEQQLNKMTNLSVYEKLINRITLSKKVYQNSEDKFQKWSTDLLTDNLVIEFIYNSMQDMVVYDGEYSRVISYYCLAIVIPDISDITEISVYYSQTSNTDNNEKNNSYKECSPLVYYGDASEIKEFAETFLK